MSTLKFLTHEGTLQVQFYSVQSLSHVWLFAIPWNSPGQNTGVGSLSLLQGIFPTQGLNQGLPHCRRILYQLSLLLGRKIMTNLDSIFKSRDITLPTKVGLVKAMVFPVVMYGCESWTIKKTECQRIDAFKLWCWRRLLRVPWSLDQGDPTSPS